MGPTRKKLVRKEKAGQLNMCFSNQRARTQLLSLKMVRGRLDIIAMLLIKSIYDKKLKDNK
jgi:hypothetical protein